MSSGIALTKMHGARNDFAVIDARAHPIDDLAAVARRVCDRRCGIGADGLIVLESLHNGAVAMRTINADGSEAEMCGNGVRCAARWLDEAREGDRVTFETAAGLVRTEIVAREPDYLVRVTMPQPRVIARSLEGFADAAIVDVGNPHAVIFATNGERIAVEELGPRLQDDPRFPGGINVHVALVDGEHDMRVRHWERGVGATQACGTGAVAAAVAAIERGTVTSPVELAVPGGVLTVEFDGRDSWLTGPAVRVFDALFDI